MKVFNTSEIQYEQPTGGMWIGKVNTQGIVGDQIAKSFRVSLVKFDPGAKNVFHTHTAEQVLYVTEGKGIVATPDEEVVVTAGMVVHIPGGERHWHGATNDSPFTHISIVGLPCKTEF